MMRKFCIVTVCQVLLDLYPLVWGLPLEFVAQITVVSALLKTPGFGGLLVENVALYFHAGTILFTTVDLFRGAKSNNIAKINVLLKLPNIILLLAFHHSTSHTADFHNKWYGRGKSNLSVN